MDLEKLTQDMNQDLNNITAQRDAEYQTAYEKIQKEEQEKAAKNIQDRAQKEKESLDAKYKDMTVKTLREKYNECKIAKEQAATKMKEYANEMQIAMLQGMPENERKELDSQYQNYLNDYNAITKKMESIRAEIWQEVDDNRINFKDVKAAILDYCKNGYELLGKAAEKAKDILHERNEQMKSFMHDLKEKGGNAVYEVKENAVNAKDQTIQATKGVTRQILQLKDHSIDMTRNAAQKIYHNVGKATNLVNLQYERESLRHAEKLLDKMEKRREFVEEFSDRRAKATGLFKGMIKAIQGKLNDGLDIDVEKNKTEQKAISYLDNQIALLKGDISVKKIHIKEITKALNIATQNIEHANPVHDAVQEMKKSAPIPSVKAPVDRFATPTQENVKEEKQESYLTNLDEDIETTAKDTTPEQTQSRDDQTHDDSEHNEDDAR